MAEGEPPKNGRNLGLKYYRCPQCGNSSMSKSVNQYVENHLVMYADALATPLSHDESNALDSVESTLVTVEHAEVKTPPLDCANETINNESTTETSAVCTVHFFTIKRVIMGLGVLIVLLWIIRTLLPKPQPQEVSHAISG